MDSHKQWLDNEYQAWAEALQSSTVHNFKEHPMVRRMLSIGMEFHEPVLQGLPPSTVDVLIAIDNIGYEDPSPVVSGDACRMVYYAKQVMDRHPASIVEIGGGAGEFYAILRALGHEGEYFIMDLVPVQMFQAEYLKEVGRLTGLKFPQMLNFDFCVSLHALGEFDDELKEFYINRIVSQCPHGFVLWNPHSGASKDIPFECTVKEEHPLLHPDCRQLEW